VNTAPVISSLPDQTTQGDKPVSVAFAVFDRETPDQITITATSSNPTLVPSENILYTLSNGSGQVVIVPVANRSGPVQITLTATDLAGLSGSKSFWLTIQHINRAPTVRITSPIPEQRFLATTSISIRAEASDTDGAVMRVDFFQKTFRGTNWIDSATSSPYAVTFQAVTSGRYELWAVATDNGNPPLIAESGHFTIEVIPFQLPELYEISVPEGHSTAGTTNVIRPFQVFRFPVTNSVALTYWTSDGGAFDGLDYGGLTNTVVLDRGITTIRDVKVVTYGNTQSDPNRYFYLNFSQPNNVQLITNRFRILITDDDPPPTVSISDAQLVIEGNSGTANEAIFTVSLSSASGKSVYVDFRTEDETATGDADYAAVRDELDAIPLHIPPGVTTGQIKVKLIGDVLDEPNETFLVKLTGASDALIDPNKNQARALIVDDDPPPTLMIKDTTTLEGNSESTNAVFAVTLSAPSTFPITVNYATADGTAIAGRDYLSANGLIPFNVGQTNQTISVPVLGDRLNEADETFFLTLSNPANAVLSLIQAPTRATILNDDPLPELLLNNPTVTALDAGSTNLVFVVSLSPASGQTVTAKYSTLDDSTRANADYAATEGTLSFAPGETKTNITVRVEPQFVNQAPKTLFLNLMNVLNATPPSLRGTGTILPGVAPPTILVGDGRVTVSSTATNIVIFTISLSARSGQAISFAYATLDGSAKAGVDYVGSTNTLSFAPGQTSTNLPILVKPQTSDQPLKSFFLTLTNVSNATPPKAPATGTIMPLPTLSVKGMDVEEGNSGPTHAVFTVLLSAPTDTRVTVDYATATGTALADIDFLGSTNTLTLNPGQTTTNITVLVYGDPFNEPNETFFVNLSNPVNAAIARGQGQAVIINDDSAPVISIADVFMIEGTGGRTTVLFPVKLSAPSGQTVTVQFETANDTAIAGNDYVATAGTLSFAPGKTEEAIPVEIIGDALSEATERFSVKLAPPVNATIDRGGEAFITIRDDDLLPRISISDVSVTEGDTGTVKAAFQVNLSAASGQPVSVNFATTNGTALAVSDYFPDTGTLDFAPNETSRTLFIQVAGDTLKEADEDFFVVLSNPVNAGIEVGRGRVLIIDNDPLPALSINDVSVVEGDSGLARAVFSVSLSPASGQQVSVRFATADGTATSASDYVAQNGQLIFDPAVTNRTITVLVNGDTFFEGDETFALTLSEPANATIAKPQGLVTIVDDDAEPALSIADVSILEGNAGTTDAIFTVHLSAPSPKPVTVRYATAGETATPGRDFAERFGTLTFNPNETSKPIAITINSDTLDEPDETFLATLSQPVNASIVKPQARGTILNDDEPPAVSIGDATVVEGNSGTTNAVFTASLSAPSGRRVSVAFATKNGTASAFSDYTPNSGLIFFEPSDTNKSVAVEIRGDTLSEANEGFFVDLISPINTRLGKGRGTGTIKDDDPLPVITINDVQVRKALSGTSQAVFTVSLSSPSGQTVSVDFATANGISIAGTDYEAVSGTLSFAAGELVRTISVPVLSAASGQSAQTFAVNLTKPLNVTIGRETATATIIDDRPLPGISITDAAVTEGNSGVVHAVLTVSLSQPSSQEVSVRYTTAEGTALAGSDYDAIPNTLLTFKPNETNKAISVAIKGDRLPEPEETFTVLLSSPSNAILLRDRAVVTITDDDTIVGISITDAAALEPDTGATNMVFTVLLSAPTSQLVTVAYATLDNTAREAEDYIGVLDVLAFPPGTTSQTIAVQIRGDTRNEDTESLFLRLSDPQNAVILRDRAIGTITDNDPLPAISISDATVTEGNSGAVSANFTVSLSSPSSKFVSVNIATLEGTATAGRDFQTASDTLTFLPGFTSRTISVPIIGDTEDEPNETFAIVLSRPVNATIENSRALGTIIDDDVPPTLLITDASVQEGNAGTTFADFTVRLSAPSTQAVAVEFRTADRSALAGSDYAATNGVLRFAPGTITNVVRVPIVGDTIKETNETFAVLLSPPTNARIIRDTGIGTILDDDVLPTLTIADAIVTEGNSGSVNATFALRLSTASAQTVSVGFQTAGGTATAGTDFKTASGTVDFAPGVVDRTLSVEVIGDTTFEADETFFVNLSTPVNAIIAIGTGVGTIRNDDSAANQPPSVRIINPANGAAFTAPAEVSVTVDAFDGDGSVSKVEFFVGSTLLGSATSAPYTVLWNNEAAGAYSLTARATDDKGAVAVSEPANVLITRRVAGAEVAIIRNFADPEISLIQNYLLEMGISSQVFEQEGLSFDAVRDARLVIWNDLGSEAQGLTDQEVAIFRQAYDAEIPLYFIGERLAASTWNLSANRQTQWAELIHLTLGAANRSDGTILLDELTKHPVVSGHFGTVGRFNGSPNVEGKLRAAEGVTLLGRSATADLIVAFEDPLSDGRIRTVSQNCRLTAGANSAAIIEQKKLFQNTVAWLMHKSFQALTDLSITIEGSADSVAVGSEFTYTISVQHQGEIEGTGALVTVSLGSGLKLSKSEFLQGTLTESNGTIFYNLGNMASAQRSTLSLVLLPTIGGTLTTRVNVAGNEPDPNALNNTATVETVVTGGALTLPALRSVGFNTQGFQLNVTGAGPGIYRVQASTDLSRWIDLTNFTGRSTPVLVTDPGASKMTPRFYRLISP